MGCRAAALLGALWSAVSLGSAALAATSEGVAQHRVPRTASPVTIDGILDEAAWESALRVTLDYEIAPGENVPPPVATECYLVHDDTHLYVAFVAHDPRPEEIRARLSDRDAIFRDDYVGIVLDTFGDRRSAYDFFVNPLGVQADLLFSQGPAGTREDLSWDAIWDSAGRLTPEGYVVEMAIPFGALRFQRTEGDQVWRFFALRSWPRDRRHVVFNAPQDRNEACVLCQAPELVGFSGVAPGFALELDPTLTALRTQHRDLTTGDLAADPTDLDLGLTASWDVTPSLTLGAAVNPDFSQVEADAAQLDVNLRFALFFPERRPFFQEAPELFDTPLPALHTRNMADPDWGIKAMAREGRHAFGLFLVDDALTTLLVPGSEGSALTEIPGSSRNAVARWRLDLGQASSLGLLYAGREGEGYHNRVAGADGRWRLSPTDHLRLQLLGSWTAYPPVIAAAFGQPAGSFSGHALSLGYQHESRSWGWSAAFEDLGAGFRADLGFLPQVDARKLRLGAHRLWRGDAESWYSLVSGGLEWLREEDQGGSLLEEGAALVARFEGPLQSFASARLGRRQRGFRGRRFDETFAELFAAAQPRSGLDLRLSARMGDEIDVANVQAAEVLVLAPGLGWSIGRRLRLELESAFQRLDVASGRLSTAQVSQLRAQWHFDRRSFLRVLLQESDVRRDPAQFSMPVPASSRRRFGQLLFSYKLNPRTVLFLGASETHLGEGERGVGLDRTERSFFAKLGYAWLL